MLKFTLTILFLISIQLLATSQEKFNAIKVFSGYEYSRESKVDNSVNEFHTNGDFNLLNSISYSFGKKDKFHEIELLRIVSGFQRDEIKFNGIITNGNKIFETEIMLRYSYNFQLTTNSQKVKSYLGIGLFPYFTNIKSKPLFGNSFEIKNQNFGITTEIIPRLNYSFNKSIFLDVNIPVSIFDVRLERRRIENPEIPLRQQIDYQLRKNFLPILVRASLGIGYKF